MELRLEQFSSSPFELSSIRGLMNETSKFYNRVLIDMTKVQSASVISDLLKFFHENQLLYSLEHIQINSKVI